MLHSTFWEQAVDPNPFTLLENILHHEQAPRDRDEKRSLPTLHASAGVFLDFLYPLGAIKFIRQHSFDTFRNATSNRGLYTSSNSEALQSSTEAPVALEARSLLGGEGKKATGRDISVRERTVKAPEGFRQRISSLLRTGQTKAALQCYRKYRQRMGRRIPPAILNALLKIASDNHSILGMQQIMEDWYRHYGKPSLVAFRMCMSSFATLGEVDIVKKLFEQYLQLVTDHGKPKISNADDIAPLLHVHASRGELDAVVEIFNSMREKYGVEPNILSWNILLNAYGKAQDVDGAFGQFQRLLDCGSPKPDDYTIGTMMGICTIRGDLDSALEFYQLAESLHVTKSTAMVDCLVRGHVQNGDLLQAEKICADSLAMNLKGPLTRMWNYLLTGYAMRRDIPSVNRILRRMKDSKVNYDSETYAGLMRALAMVKQPDRAREILMHIMPEAGYRVTPSHYAVVMGGYLATREYDKVFPLYNAMLRQNKDSESARMLALKAVAKKQLVSAPSQEPSVLAVEQFLDAYSMGATFESSASMKKGLGRHRGTIEYQPAFYGYLISVLGHNGAFTQAKELYQRYLDSLPNSERAKAPLEILAALMDINWKAKAYDDVQDCWNLAVERAKESGRPIGFQKNSETTHVLPLYQYALVRPLSIQISSLVEQQKSRELLRTVEDVQEAGFKLDNSNWNLYIQGLLATRQYKEAFTLCEQFLMQGWRGWARSRWIGPQRNRLPRSVRRDRMRTDCLHPHYRTLLSLAKVYADFEAASTARGQLRHVLDGIEKECLRTIYAIKSMPMVPDDLQRQFLGR
jgi:pentatricopeptide repeat-containing protein PET309